MSLAQHFLSQSATHGGEGRRAEAVAAARAAVDVLHGIEAPAGHEAQYFSLLAEALRTFGNRLIEAGRPEEATQPTQDAMQAEQLAASFG